MIRLRDWYLRALLVPVQYTLADDQSESQWAKRRGLCGSGRRWNELRRLDAAARTPSYIRDAEVQRFARRQRQNQRWTWENMRGHRKPQPIVSIFRRLARTVALSQMAWQVQLFSLNFALLVQGGEDRRSEKPRECELHPFSAALRVRPTQFRVKCQIPKRATRYFSCLKRARSNPKQWRGSKINSTRQNPD